MLSADKKTHCRRKTEEGFVLIAAILAVLIIMAVSLLILTTTTQDARISARMIGERKAFSAAESGVHEVCRLLNPANLAAVSTAPNWSSIDSTNAPTIQYKVDLPVRNANIPTVPLPGYDLSKAYVGSVFDTVIHGRDTSYTPDVETSIAVGTVYAPNPSDTQQGAI